MTDRARQRFEVAALAIIFGAGSGWAGMELKLTAISQKVDRIDARVSAIYCGQVPPDRRAGCQ